MFPFVCFLWFIMLWFEECMYDACYLNVQTRSPELSGLHWNVFPLLHSLLFLCSWSPSYCGNMPRCSHAYIKYMKLFKLATELCISIANHWILHLTPVNWRTACKLFEPKLSEWFWRFRSRQIHLTKRPLKHMYIQNQWLQSVKKKQPPYTNEAWSCLTQIWRVNVILYIHAWQFHNVFFLLESMVLLLGLVMTCQQSSSMHLFVQKLWKDDD